MKIDNSFKAIFASMMIVSGLVACDKPGTAESAGKKIDQTTESVSTAVSNTADKADKAITEQGKQAKGLLSDTEITSEVKTALLNEPDLKSMKIMVTTQDGVVTLAGSTNSLANKMKIEKLSKTVDGVKSTVNNITIVK